jgi:membrane protein required for colicin V production
MNSFDIVVLALALTAVVMGFQSGLLRSVATIIGYLCAAPVALVATPGLSSLLAERAHVAATPPLVFVGIFLVVGIITGALLRTAISELVGPEPSLPDRIAGATLGAVRIGLLAVLMVVIFDRMIPPDREPGFLKESRLRPALSWAGQRGLRSLPPEVADYIDRLKRERIRA